MIRPQLIVPGEFDSEYCSLDRLPIRRKTTAAIIWRRNKSGIKLLCAVLVFVLAPGV
jgi:hypothetical protein